MKTKRLALMAIAMAMVLAAGCSRRENRDDRHTVAHKVGAAAFDVAHESEKLAKKAGQELKEATHEAHQGWKDAAARHKEQTRP